MLFDKDTISDQKRLARGEHLLAARTQLRGRDGVHHKAWRVLMLAGGAPAGEVCALRELMPKCWIAAVDTNAQCLDAAINAGVDEVLHADLMDGDEASPGVSALGKFDLIDLDFCGPASRDMRKAICAYRHLLTPRGVMMVTFSVGRDVEEVGRLKLQDVRRLTAASREPREFPYGREKANQGWKLEQLGRLSERIPEHLLGRVLLLLSLNETTKLKSVIYYRGASMPMCSLLVLFGPGDHDTSFVKLEPGDFELAACYPASAALYDCPEDRIKSLRQRHAALKAAITRSRVQREEPVQSAPMVQ